MAMSRFRYDGSRTSATQTTRTAIALARNGASHSGNCVADASNRAAVTHHSDVIPRPLQQFRDLSTAGLIPTSTQFDNTSRLLDVLDVPAIATGAVSEAGNWPGVVLVGCQGSGDAMLNGWFERMLGRGAIIVSIDRSAAIPIISSRLNAGAIRPGCRARVAVRTDLIDSPDTTARLGCSRLPPCRRTRIWVWSTLTHGSAGLALRPSCWRSC